MLTVATPAPPPLALVIIVVVIALTPIRRIDGCGSHDDRARDVHARRLYIDRLRRDINGRRLGVDNAWNPNAYIDIHACLGAGRNGEQCAA